jgi:hypothetical protein
MKIIRYFKELLATLKQIEANTKKISRCVGRAPQDRGDCIVTKHWNT